MKKLLKKGMLLLSFMFIASISIAQDVVHRDWSAFPTSENQLNISWAIIECPDASMDQINLSLKNELSAEQTANFILTLSEEGQADVTYSVSELTIAAGVKVVGDCGVTSSEKLAFDVPVGFTMNGLSISIKYN